MTQRWAPKLEALWERNYSVYGRRKLTRAAKKAGLDIGRDQVARLMRANGLRGASRAKKRFTTHPDPAAVRAPDLVKRDFTATRPNHKWVADFTYCSTWSGVVYVAFVTDVFSRRIVGWKVSRSMTAALVVDALNMAAWVRRGVELAGLICHSDAGSQTRTLRAAIASRLGALGLELHPDKTKIVYCKDTKRRGNSEHVSFDFLGYTFRGRTVPGRRGLFVGFNPAMSTKAAKAVGQEIRAWHLNRRSGTDLSGLAEDINPQVRGWIGYYGAFYRSNLHPIARRIDQHLVRWAMQKFKRLRGKPLQAWAWLTAARQHQPKLFAHWHLIARTPGRPVGAR